MVGIRPGGSRRNIIRSTSHVLAEKFGTRSTTKQYRRLIHRRLVKSRKRLIRTGLLLANITLLLGVTVFLLHSSPSGGAVKPVASVSDAQTSVVSNPLDQLSSADIAVQVARLTGLDEAVSATNHADSVSQQITMAPATAQASVINKPQLINNSNKSRKDIQAYMVKEGDTVGSLAAKFGVPSESIRWSNSVAGDSLTVGAQLLIPPVPGIVYTVKSGDTPESVAQRYNANKDAVVAFNDAEVGGLKPGERVVIPDGIVIPPPVARPAGATPAVGPARYAGGFAFGSAAIYGYNGYDPGWCTWYVANKRAAAGRPIPANLGDAWTWDDRAPAAGFGVGSTPAAGAVITNRVGAPGHVGYVEQVLDDGSIWVSDMNSHGQVSPSDPTPAGGFFRVSWRHVDPSQFGKYNFIY